MAQSFVKKKRVLICSHWMEIGGAERALLGLLYSFDYSQYVVDLYLCRHTGEFLKYLPNSINILPEDKNAASIAIPVKDAIKKGCLGVVFGRLVGKYKAKRFIKRNQLKTNCVGIEYSNRYTYRFVKMINPNVTYDLAISFLEPHYIALYKAKAKFRIAWMHTDYSFVAVDSNEGVKIWSRYDAIAAISEDCWKSFVKTYPTLEKKLFLIENINHPGFIKSLSTEYEASEMIDNNSVNLLSIGRYCYQKNFENIPFILSEIHKSIPNVKWFIIGYGDDESERLIKEKISLYHMEKSVILLGKRTNPYPYVKACDIYVQPSRYEGKSVAVREAQILGKPVIITNYPTSLSQLIDGYDGVIVPMENKACADAIKNVIQDKELQDTLINNTKQTNYSNTDEIHKLYRLI